MPTAPLHDPAVMAALDAISEFVEKTTGTAPTSAELANALTRYFVLNEIKEHIEMLREGE
ncbi:hypothetical protein LJC71_09295 [Desulfosarcina sp. OttesenSCG-928-A07]|nr:hypothetical protein [Desulfosarcina sp. OttesenSCG-928-G17]MDL2329918.1 hypothetical protein [Desulfosarcina sp. OttesenSCG-928-A07]